MALLCSSNAQKVLHVKDKECIHVNYIKKKTNTRPSNSVHLSAKELFRREHHLSRIYKAICTASPKESKLLFMVNIHVWFKNQK
jgi:hypothetical protein